MYMVPSADQTRVKKKKGAHIATTIMAATYRCMHCCAGVESFTKTSLLSQTDIYLFAYVIRRPVVSCVHHLPRPRITCYVCPRTIHYLYDRPHWHKQHNHYFFFERNIDAAAPTQHNTHNALLARPPNVLYCRQYGSLTQSQSHLLLPQGKDKVWIRNTCFIPSKGVGHFIQLTPDLNIRRHLP